MNESVIKKAWDQVYESGNETDNHLLFGSRKTGVLSSTMHPEQVQIFRLWHIYLENVNPLLKVTHTSTLQLRIIDAASNMASISPGLEALLFSIYCISILSLPEDECCALFGSPRGDLLGDYQLACRQALLNCNVLQSGDRDCLTALYLYLVRLFGSRSAYAPLMNSGLGQTSNRPPISILDARRCYPDCTTHRNPQRVHLC